VGVDHEPLSAMSWPGQKCPRDNGSRWWPTSPIRRRIRVGLLRSPRDAAAQPRMITQPDEPVVYRRRIEVHERTEPRPATAGAMYTHTQRPNTWRTRFIDNRSIEAMPVLQARSPSPYSSDGMLPGGGKTGRGYARSTSIPGVVERAE